MPTKRFHALNLAVATLLPLPSLSATIVAFDIVGTVQLIDTYSEDSTMPPGIIVGDPFSMSFAYDLSKGFTEFQNADAIIRQYAFQEGMSGSLKIADYIWSLSSLDVDRAEVFIEQRLDEQIFGIILWDLAGTAENFPFAEDRNRLQLNFFSPSNTLFETLKIPESADDLNIAAGLETGTYPFFAQARWRNESESGGWQIRLDVTHPSDVEISVIPEPQVYALALGLLAVGLVVWRRSYWQG